MTIGLYVLLGIILVLLLIFLGLYFHNLKKPNSQGLQGNLHPELLQKDIEASRNILKEKIDALQREISENKQTITTTLQKLDENANKTNLDFIGKLSTLNEQLTNLKSDLQNQDRNLKNTLDGQKQNLNNSFNEVFKDLTTLVHTSKSLKTVEEKIVSLNNVFLNNSKTRGNLGEYLLEKLLSDLYGDAHEMWTLQYKLPDGNVVDALVKTGNNKEDIALDSKFPLTNYNKYVQAEDKHTKEQFLKDFKRDFKIKIDEVAKYISKKNEISSVIMFIPSEDLFSFVYANFQGEIIKSAFQRKVWITSPTTLSAILFILDKHLQESRFNQNLEFVRKNLLKLKDEFERWIDRWAKLRADLEKVQKDVSELDKTHEKISRKYQAIYKDQVLEQKEIFIEDAKKNPCAN